MSRVSQTAGSLRWRPQTLVQNSDASQLTVPVTLTFYNVGLQNKHVVTQQGTINKFFYRFTEARELGGDSAGSDDAFPSTAVKSLAPKLALVPSPDTDAQNRRKRAHRRRQCLKRRQPHRRGLCDCCRREFNDELDREQCCNRYCRHIMCGVCSTRVQGPPIPGDWRWFCQCCVDGNRAPVGFGQKAPHMTRINNLEAAAKVHP